MIIVGTLNVLLALLIGLITAIVSYRIFQNKLSIGSPVIGLCAGVLTGLGLASHRGVDMSSILIPYEALGIAILVMLFLLPILNGKKRKDQNRKDLKSLPNQSHHTTNTSDDPWEKEILRRSRMVKKNEARKLN